MGKKRGGIGLGATSARVIWLKGKGIEKVLRKKKENKPPPSRIRFHRRK